MRVAVFLTTERDAAAALLRSVRDREPSATLVAFANDEDRAALLANFPGIEFRRDKPPGGKLAFVRALRGERFDRVVVAWHGGERLQPLRIAALLLGAPVAVHDERGRVGRVGLLRPWTWLPHLLRRAVRTDALAWARAGAAAYRATIGLVVASLWLPVRALLSRR